MHLDRDHLAALGVPLSFPEGPPITSASRLGDNIPSELLDAVTRRLDRPANAPIQLGVAPSATRVRQPCRHCGRMCRKRKGSPAGLASDISRPLTCPRCHRPRCFACWNIHECGQD